MKNKFCLLALTVAMALTGCDHKDADVGTKAGDMVDAAKDQAATGKDEFVAAMGKKMKDLNGKIDELAKRSAGYKDEAKVQADKALDELRAQRDTLAAKCDELQKSGQDAWEKTKAGVESAWGNVEKAYENAKSKFN